MHCRPYKLGSFECMDVAMKWESILDFPSCAAQGPSPLAVLVRCWLSSLYQITFGRFIKGFLVCGCTGL